jgi:hypothetical protein
VAHGQAETRVSDSQEVLFHRDDNRAGKEVSDMRPLEIVYFLGAVISIVAFASMLVGSIVVPSLVLDTAGPFWVEFPVGCVWNWVTALSIIIGLICGIGYFCQHWPD